MYPPDPLGILAGVIIAIAMLAVVAVASRATIGKLLRERLPAAFTKKDKIYYWSVLGCAAIGSVALLAVAGYLFGYEAYVSYVGASAVAVAVFLLRLLIMCLIPAGPKDIDEAYDEFPEDSPSVSVRLSENNPDRKFNVFVDERKVAKVYRGREVQVLMPAGEHMVSVSASKPARSTGSTIEISDGLALLIGADMKNKKQPVWIMTLPGDEDALEEATRRARRRIIIMFGAITATFIMSAIFFFVSLFLRPDIFAG